MITAEGSLTQVDAHDVEALASIQPSSIELSLYIAEMSTELARMADSHRLPPDIAYLLKMTALSSSMWAGRQAARPNLRAKRVL